MMHYRAGRGNRYHIGETACKEWGVENSCFIYAFFSYIGKTQNQDILSMLVIEVTSAVNIALSDKSLEMSYKNSAQ